MHEITFSLKIVICLHMTSCTLVELYMPICQAPQYILEHIWNNRSYAKYVSQINYDFITFLTFDTKRAEFLTVVNVGSRLLLLFSFLAQSSGLKMEAIHSSETSDTLRTTRRYNPEVSSGI